LRCCGSGFACEAHGMGGCPFHYLIFVVIHFSGAARTDTHRTSVHAEHLYFGRQRLCLRSLGVLVAHTARANVQPHRPSECTCACACVHVCVSHTSCHVIFVKPEPSSNAASSSVHTRTRPCMRPRSRTHGIHESNTERHAAPIACMPCTPLCAAHASSALTSLDEFADGVFCEKKHRRRIDPRSRLEPVQPCKKPMRCDSPAVDGGLRSEETGNPKATRSS